MIWIIVIIAAVVGLWYWIEGSWDRGLFQAAPGSVCENLNAVQANAWLREHPETQVLDVRSKGEFDGGGFSRVVSGFCVKLEKILLEPLSERKMDATNPHSRIIWH